MRKTLATFAVVALALAGCGTTGEDEATVSNTPAPTTSKTSTTHTSSSATSSPESSTSEAEEPAEVQPAVEESAAAPAEPQIASCATDPTLYQRGTTWFTDGTSGWTQTCADQMPAAAPDLSDIPYADGGTCAAAICGYGHDANGNPNKSSGEIQTQDGCEKGYITDPELCAAVGY